MQIPPPGAVGWVLALIALVIDLVFFLTGHLAWPGALLFGLLALARML